MSTSSLPFDSNTLQAHTNMQDFERLNSIVTAEFRIEESLIEHSIPTFYLERSQKTKKPFLRLLKNLEELGLIAFLREEHNRLTLRIVPKPPVRKSNVMVNWLLFFATIATTFITGYILSQGFLERGLMSSPIIGGAAFMVAILTVLGMHEIGHKIAAGKSGIDATPPYFIPGPPPLFGTLGIGTFGAVIMQKSLPPNRDALFDVGANGPIVGFILAVIVSLIGLLLSPTFPIQDSMGFLPAPLIFEIFAIFVLNLPVDHYVLLHPVAFAGWVGMVVTMLNLLPASMLDGGHIARSIVGEKVRTVLTFLSILLLFIQGFWPMAVFVLLLATRRHPGPLDDVSSLSRGRKLMILLLIAIFVLCSFPIFLPF
ncbi:MAG: site-2 protease family protein [Candidatus Bathyarchaeota archaeon]|jgi:membrane-associated protease RseP (regulator of RpoE activity)